MFKKALRVVKKIVVAAVSIYGYNLVAAPLGAIVPINILTVGVVSILGIPSLLGIIVLMIAVF